MSKRAKKIEDSEEYLSNLDKYWRATNYLAAAQLYMKENPLLRRPLTRNQVKTKIVGHWGTVPGQNFIYVHMNRAITKYNLDMILISGPGHGGNFFVANSYLEGHYSEIYPNVSLDEEGMSRLCKQFSFPGGISSHVAPETPGSINEGGELGYSIAHAFGSVFDNPNLITTCIVGDGEAETGPLATAWHSNKFLNPATDGAVLPILHLNGYKISNPTVFARISKEEVRSFFKGCGWDPIFVEATPETSHIEAHKAMAAAVDKCIEKIKRIQHDARKNGKTERPFWPMIVLRTPKGWTGPKFNDDGLPIENSFRAHQVPIDLTKPDPNEEKHMKELEEWLRSYKPDELFDENYRLKSEIAAIAPKGEHRISANPHANGGKLLKDLRTP
ncbi:MAG: phosphoketolase family protein, partial [Treponema sp.]|nr:phosphoketolase family protein [Treponema sp.]